MGVSIDLVENPVIQLNMVDNEVVSVDTGQGVTVSKDGIKIGSTRWIDFVTGSNISLSVTKTNGKILVEISSTASGGGGSGDVTGPASSTDGGIALFNGATGKIIKADGLTPSDDDFLQRKSGAWSNRTIAEVRTDLAFITDIRVMDSYTATNNPNSVLPLGNSGTPSASFRLFDLTNYVTLRVYAGVSVLSASVNNPRIYAQYSTNAGGAWNTIGTGLTDNMISLSSTGNAKSTTWITIPVGARADVLLRIVTDGGDGAADPLIVAAGIQVRM